MPNKVRPVAATPSPRDGQGGAWAARVASELTDLSVDERRAALALLSRHLLCDNDANDDNGSKVKQQDEAQGLLASTEAPPFNTVITFGTFDVLHHGHVRILQRAAAYGRRLVVGLSTDELNMSKKQRRPVYPYDQRKAILEAISCVDMVFAEESLEKKESYCRQHGADVLVMGDDWVGKFDAVGIEVRYLERTPAVSTTQTIELCTMLHGQKQSG